MRMSYNYKPSRQNGTGVGYHNMGEGIYEVTKEEWQNVVAFGRNYARSHGANLYYSIDEFMKDEWHKKVYEEL